MKKITFVCAIAMLVAFALPAQAAVQNVKVGGDITIRGIYQKSYDLHKDDGDTSIPPLSLGADAGHSEGAQVFMSTIGLNVEADLTDNVSAMVRLVSQFDWNRSGAACGTWGANGVDILTEALWDRFDVQLDLAYITLKEMLYSPLTLIIGRQDLWFGDGFIIGGYYGNPDPHMAIMADEYTDLTSFDAIRAILDYDPWTVNLVYARIDAGLFPVPDGINDDERQELYGVNVGYVFGEYDAEMEGYWFGLHWGPTTSVGTDLESNFVHTLGIRGSVMPIENLDLRGEFAFQVGDYGATKADREAYALDLRGEYCWADYAWMPTLGLEYVFYSGEDQSASGDWEQWHPMFRGKFFSAIREWQEVYYSTDDGSDDAHAMGNTNEHQIIVDGSLQPTDNILMELRYLHFIAHEEDAQRDDDIGNEVDLRLTYEYTEDVTFSLLTAWFFPGDLYDAPYDDTATEIVGTVSLVF